MTRPIVTAEDAIEEAAKYHEAIIIGLPRILSNLDKIQQHREYAAAIRALASHIAPTQADQPKGDDNGRA